MRSKELWLVKKKHATVKPDSSIASRGMKTYCKIYKSWRKCWKNQVSLSHWSTPAEKLWRSSFEWIERRVNDSRDCLSPVVGDSQISLQYCWPWAVLSYTLLAGVPWNEWNEWNIRVWKQGYVLILSVFNKWCFDVSFLTSTSVSTVILTLGKVEFFK